MLILKGESLQNLQESFPLPAAKQGQTSYLYTGWQFIWAEDLVCPCASLMEIKPARDKASVPLWILLEAEPKMRDQAQVPYLGGDPSKHGWDSGIVRQENQEQKK